MKNDLTPDAAMGQASMTAKNYMLEAYQDIDSVFGDNYAVAHPELIGAYMITAALDFHAASGGNDLGLMTDAIDRVVDALRRNRY